MKFRRWVDAQGGPKGVGEKLGISANRVRMWLRRESSPQAILMQKLVKSGRGKFSYDDLINETTKGRRGVR